MSRIRGTRRTQEGTRGHDGAGNGAQEDTGGNTGTQEDTRYGRFGTVRPRVQIPGPRPVLNSEPSSHAIQRVPGGHWGSRGDHKFLGEHGASSPFEVVPGPLLNLGIVIRRQTYQ
jgi:hypothetical protein